MGAKLRLCVQNQGHVLQCKRSFPPAFLFVDCQHPLHEQLTAAIHHTHISGIGFGLARPFHAPSSVAFKIQGHRKPPRPEADQKFVHDQKKIRLLKNRQAESWR